MAEFTERWHTRFRGAQRDLIDACGGVERVAELTSYGKSTVGRWRGPNDRDPMPYPVVLVLEDDCGRPILTKLMAEFNGRTLGDPESRGEQVASLLSQVADLSDRSTALVVETVRAKSDGVVTPAEAESLRSLLSRVEEISSQIGGALSGVKADGGLRVVRDSA